MAGKVIHAFQKTADTFAEGAKTLPQKYFVSPQVFAEEQKIFAKHWLLVGHQSQLANVGDYVVQRVIGESLIVIRDKIGEIRGFFNVCRHRGTTLIEHGAGEAGAGQGRVRVRNVGQGLQVVHHDRVHLEFAAVDVRVARIRGVHVAAAAQRVGLLHAVPPLEVGRGIHGQAIFVDPDRPIS